MLQTPARSPPSPFPPAGVVNNSSQVPLVQGSKGVPMDDLTSKEEEKPEVKRLFSFLQVLTATFGSFAHGGTPKAVFLFCSLNYRPLGTKVPLLRIKLTNGYYMTMVLQT